MQHRVESVVSFSHGYVEQLQEEQKQRHKENIRKKPKEFRSSSEMQIEGMLAKSDYSCSRSLHEKLQGFTDDLKRHCGSPNCTTQISHEMSSSEKLRKLVKLLTSFEGNEVSGNSTTTGTGTGTGTTGDSGSDGSHVISLQRLITQTMINWASREIQDLRLIEEVFSLLYRQFNEVGEVVQALNKTYVLEVTKDPTTGKPNFDIPAFCDALGSLRLLLKVGMSKKEENLLKNSLKYVVCCVRTYICVCVLISLLLTVCTG